jgi:hypothetical protein
MSGWRFVPAAIGLALLVAAQGTGAAETWTFVNATSVLANGKLLAGRVNAAVSDPRNPEVMFVATDGARPTGPDGNPKGNPAVGLPDTGGGGVWKTTGWLGTKPPHWTALTDGMPSLSIGVHGLAMAPSNPDILYAAADGPQGAILKTTDGGKHWRALATSRFAGVKFGGIAVSSADPNTVFAAVFRAAPNTPGGIYKSKDGGASWAITGGLDGDVSNIAIDPTNHQILYAGVVDPDHPDRQGVWKRLDGGRSWSPQRDNFPAGTFKSTLFIEFAIASMPSSCARRERRCPIFIRS